MFGVDSIEMFSKVVAGLTAAYPALRWVAIRLWRPIRDHYAGVHKMIRTVERIDGEVTAIKERVEAELTANGGGSIKDQVNTISARQAAMFDSMKRAAFQTDAIGNFISVNRAFEHLTGYPARDLLGKGWVNLLHHEDVDCFMEAWEHTIRDGRILRRPCTIVTATGIEMRVHVDAVPVRRGAVVIEWQGSFEDVEAAA